MIAVIDLGLSNVNSVSRALSYLRVANTISSCEEDIAQAEKLILPGVGNFAEAARRLEASGLGDVIRREVLDKKKPLLGICLGMQLLAGTGEEGGLSKGLGLIDAKVSRLRSEATGHHLPHIGWNDVDSRQMRIFSEVPDHSAFYFVHSYEMLVKEDVEIATAHYGIDFVAAVKKANILGAQFHPEKSQRVGLQVLANFAKGIF